MQNNDDLRVSECAAKPRQLPPPAAVPAEGPREEGLQPSVRAGAQTEADREELRRQRPQDGANIKHTAAENPRETRCK